MRRSRRDESPSLKVLLSIGIDDPPHGLEVYVRNWEAALLEPNPHGDRRGVIATILCSEEDLTRFGARLQARLETLQQ